MSAMTWCAGSALSSAHGAGTSDKPGASAARQGMDALHRGS
ncbi:hypothetical protein [Ramlibacter sp.]|nr:hypothetical protein [Ramlibacter sp.]